MKQQIRHGAITILGAVLTIVLIAMVAFCVDIGYVLTAKEEMQRTADAAALAACWEYGLRLSEGQPAATAAAMARDTASQYAAQNEVTNAAVSIDANSTNSANGDIVFGYVSDLATGANSFQTGDPSKYNAIRLTVRKNSSLNGEVPYFFARIFGMQGQVLQSEATAAIVRDAAGFRTPADGSNIDLLPFALDRQTWNSWMAGNGSDNWTWDSQYGKVVAGSDGMLEINLYPQGTGSPGNRGTVDVGGVNNSTADIARQILDGISPQDLQALANSGRQLVFDECGELKLNGDTGISAGVKDELAAIIGEPRVIPVFSEVQGPGNNAEYTIVKWFGIRIMAVKMTGPMSAKHVTIQAAPIVVKGVVPSTESGTSAFVYSPVVLVK